jgi:hypothetical protein
LGFKANPLSGISLYKDKIASFSALLQPGIYKLSLPFATGSFFILSSKIFIFFEK